MYDLAGFDHGQEPASGQAFWWLIAQLIAKGRAGDLNVLIPAPRKDAANARRAAGGDDQIVVKIVVVFGLAFEFGGDVGVASGERQTPVRNQLVPVRHHVGFGHHRQAREIGLCEGIRIDSAQPLGMPRGFGLGERQRFAQSPLPLSLDLILGPFEARHVRR